MDEEIRQTVGGNIGRSIIIEDRGIQTEFEDLPQIQRPVSYPAKASSSSYVFSFFSGCGFLDLGFEKAGFEIVIANELSSEFAEAHHYSRNRMGMPLPSEGYHQGSVEELLTGAKRNWLSSHVKTYKKKGLVGFVGGPPCPDFSVGGKNRGKDGERGKLTNSYFDLIIEQKPDWFLFENVKGLWKTKKHREFYDEMKQMALAAGYSVSDRLINSIEYGVPQDRERIIMVGFCGSLLKKIGAKAGEVIDEERVHWGKYMTANKSDLFAMPWPQKNAFGAKIAKPRVPKELTVEHWFSSNDVENHPNAVHCFKPREGLARFLSVEEGDDSKKSYKRLHRWRYSPTACYGNNEVHLHPTLPRRISVAEALALQSLPRGFVLPPGMTLSAMFKTIGNGVPFLAAYGLAKMIRDITGQKK